MIDYSTKRLAIESVEQLHRNCILCNIMCNGIVCKGNSNGICLRRYVDGILRKIIHDGILCGRGRIELFNNNNNHIGNTCKRKRKESFATEILI